MVGDGDGDGAPQRDGDDGGEPQAVGDDGGAPLVVGGDGGDDSCHEQHQPFEQHDLPDGASDQHEPAHACRHCV